MKQGYEVFGRAWGVCDFLNGWRFYQDRPLDAWELMKKPDPLKDFPDYYRGLFRQAAISAYDPMQDHDYRISRPNAYYLRLMEVAGEGKWAWGRMPEILTGTQKRRQPCRRFCVEKSGKPDSWLIKIPLLPSGKRGTGCA